MSERYTQYNTQIIDPDIDPQESIEFLELGNINVIEKIPYKNQVDLFYKDVDDNVLYGTFELKENEFYEGSAKVITYQIFQDIDNILVRSSYYRPSEYFYFFYENVGNVYLRTFKKKQGTLGEELLVFENGSLESIKVVKENYIITVKDTNDLVLLQKARSNIDGEIKMVFLMEKDIAGFESGVHSELPVQIFDIPFQDIGENLFEVPNEVENDKKMYINSDVHTSLQLDTESINGISLYSGVVTEMDHDDSFVIIMRHRPILDMSISGSPGSTTLFETDNFALTYHLDKLNLTLSNGYTYDFVKPVTSAADEQQRYNVSIFSVNTIGDKYVFSLANADTGTDVGDYTLESIVYENTTFEINETFLKTPSGLVLDYLAIKNSAMPQNVMIDLIRTMNGTIYEKYVTENGYITASEIEEERARRVLDVEQKSVHPLPDDVIVAPLDFSIDENGNSYHINSLIEVTSDDGITQADIYVESDGLFRNNMIDAGIIYAKSDSIIDANGKSLTIYHEKRATLLNIDNCFLIEVETLYFEALPTPVLSTDIVAASAYPSYDFLSSNYLSPFNNEVSPAILVEGYDTRVDQMSGNASFVYVKRFIDNGDGTLTDTTLGITIAKSPIYVKQIDVDVGASGVLKLYDRYLSAEYEVNNVQIAGQSDWRNATREEISSWAPFLSAGIYDDIPVTNTGTYNGNIVAPFGECGYLGAPSTPTSAAPLDYYALDSDVFDMDYYNGISIDNKLVKSDLIWISAGQVYSISNDAFFETDVIVGCPATLAIPVRETEAEVGIYAKFDNGRKILLPNGEDFYLNESGRFVFEKSHSSLELISGGLSYQKRVYFEEEEGIKYIENEHHTSSNVYFYGTNVFIDRYSTTKEANGTVFPMKLEDRFDIHRKLFNEPENNIRICEHFKQRSDLIPFKIDYDTAGENVVLWTTLNRLKDKIGFQYSLARDNLFNNVYDDYEVFSRRVYSQDEYFSAFHFGELIKQNQKLIDEISIDDNGELLLIGKTQTNTYAREINKIRFFDTPKRYKSASIILEVDVAKSENVQSYINNHDDIRDFLLRIIKQWIPANVILEDIVEKETLVMAELLQDEYTQVLVGLTPLGNFNAYYNRTVDSREIALVSSSDVSLDKINWLGIPQLNTTYLKAGVTKVINEKKNIKVTFDTKFSNANYRVFVFSPYNAKFYTPVKERDGFIVESSSSIREEISWIAVATTEIANGSILWKRGVPNGEVLVDNLDRITEISKNSNSYTFDFTNFGYPNFVGNDYTVILSTDKNVNVWVDNKTPNSFTIRRSYVGDDLSIDWLVVKGNSRWWSGITS